MVGANGVGKSSLLRILAGILEPIEGIVVRERGVRVGFLPQEPTFDGFVTIRDFIDNGASEQLLLIRRMRHWLRIPVPIQKPCLL